MASQKAVLDEAHKVFLRHKCKGLLEALADEPEKLAIITLVIEFAPVLERMPLHHQAAYLHKRAALLVDVSVEDVDGMLSYMRSYHGL